MPSNEPKLYQHCVSLYSKLYEHSEERADGRVFVGVISQLITDLGLAQSYQSKIVNRLRLMGCVTMLKRGGGAAPSWWLLHKEPTINDFNDSDDTGERRLIKEQEKQNALEQRVQDLNRRIQRIEEWAMDQGAPI